LQLPALLDVVVLHFAVFLPPVRESTVADAKLPASLLDAGAFGEPGFGVAKQFDYLFGLSAFPFREGILSKKVSQSYRTLSNQQWYSFRGSGQPAERLTFLIPDFPACTPLLAAYLTPPSCFTHANLLLPRQELLTQTSSGIAT